MEDKIKFNTNCIVAFGLLLGLMGCTTPQEKSSDSVPKRNENTVQADWKHEIQQKLKAYGHRNWIVVADAAYPKQSNPAIETIWIDDGQLEAVAYISELVEKATHVDANIFVDKEMAFVAEKYAAGIETYRNALDNILEGKPLKSMLHEDIIKELDKSAELFNILILKTDLAIPYTSVFFQLECGYWNAESERTLRSKMIEVKQ